MSLLAARLASSPLRANRFSSRSLSSSFPRLCRSSGRRPLLWCRLRFLLLFILLIVVIILVLFVVVLVFFLISIVFVLLVSLACLLLAFLYRCDPLVILIHLVVVSVLFVAIVLVVILVLVLVLFLVVFVFVILLRCVFGFLLRPWAGRCFTLSRFAVASLVVVLHGLYLLDDQLVKLNVDIRDALQPFEDVLTCHRHFFGELHEVLEGLGGVLGDLDDFRA
mmetsp:Transcript_14902/g.36465  ORF Transcript_14902/g.36465 Transcript_14902/m.36465 type:complete len:222 (+) Transcript_14902:380-1045(+)